MNKRGNSPLNTRDSESAKRQRENAKYVKNPKTSSAHNEAKQLLQRESCSTQQRTIWERTHLTTAFLPCSHRHTLLSLCFCFCRGFPLRIACISSAKIIVFDRKKGGMPSMSLVWNQRAEENARTEAWRRDEHTQKFCGSQRKLLP